MKRIRKGDQVIVICGKSKGKTGNVLLVKQGRVVVQGANFIKKHVKPNPQINQQGGIIEKEAPLDISNVALYNPVTQKADRVGFRFIEKEGVTHKVRYFKSTNEGVDLV